MNKTFLITRPEHDDTTHYLSKWSQQLIDLANKKGINTIDLNKSRANKKEVESILSKKNPELIMFNGHGNVNIVTGHDNEVLIQLGKNDDLLKSKIVYALSCKSAKELGAKGNAKTYIGYDDDFIFIYEPNKITHPTEDKTAKLFLEPSNEVVISLIKENPAKEAHERSQKLFQDRINKLLTSEATPDAAIIARYLWWNMKHQVCLGNKEAVF